MNTIIKMYYRILNNVSQNNYFNALAIKINSVENY